MPPGSTAHRARHQQPDAAEQFGPADEAPKPAQQPHAAKHFHGAVEVAELVEACFDEEQGQGSLQDPGDDVADGRAHRKDGWVRADENGRAVAGQRWPAAAGTAALPDEPAAELLQWLRCTPWRGALPRAGY